MSGKESKQKTGPLSDWFKNSKGSHGSGLNLSLRPADSYSYSVCSSSSSPSSPPWSPYWSPTTKSHTGIPFSWEKRPGVSKDHKSPTLDGCFGEHSTPSPSEFSLVEAFQVERQPKKRVDEVDPFVSAFVECTKKPVAAMSMAKDGRQGRGKQGSMYSCMKSCTIKADALIAIPARARQLSRQYNNNIRATNGKIRNTIQATNLARIRMG